MMPPPGHPSVLSQASRVGLARVLDQSARSSSVRIVVQYVNSTHGTRTWFSSKPLQFRCPEPCKKYLTCSPLCLAWHSAHCSLESMPLVPRVPHPLGMPCAPAHPHAHACTLIRSHLQKLLTPPLHGALQRRGRIALQPYLSRTSCPSCARTSLIVGCQMDESVTTRGIQFCRCPRHRFMTPNPLLQTHR